MWTTRPVQLVNFAPEPQPDSPYSQECLDPLVKLKDLSLSQNIITNFSNILKAVQYLPHLDYFDLINTSIISLDLGPRSLVSLTQLSLQWGKLRVCSVTTSSGRSGCLSECGIIQNMNLETLLQLRSSNLSGILVTLVMLPAKHLQNLRKINFNKQEFRGGHLNTVCQLLRILPILENWVFSEKCQWCRGHKVPCQLYQTFVMIWFTSMTVSMMLCPAFKAESKQVPIFLCQQQDLDYLPELEIARHEPKDSQILHFHPWGTYVQCLFL